MSADNWAQCPRCMEQHKQSIKDAEEHERRAYGKLPPEDYMALVRENAERTEPDSTLREDYEIGVYQGVFSIHYTGACKVCGFRIRFEHKRPALESGS